MSKVQKKLLQDLQQVIRRYSESGYNPAVVLEVLSRSMRRIRGRQRPVRLLRKPAVAPASPHEILKEQRRRMGLSVSTLARRAEIAQPNLSAMESGKRPIGLAVARKLAKALGVDYRILV